MFWRDEWVTPGSRWEIKKVDEYDPEHLEAEGKTLPLPPPVLGIRYFFWKHAPRAVPIGKDPLRWLKLSTDDWQVSGDQIVAKGDGGHGTDDEDDDSWESLPRFPDQPELGPRDLWDKAKYWVTRVVSREHPELSDRQVLQTVVNPVKQNGWLWLAELFLCNVPEELQKRLGDGMPISPNWRTVRDYFVDQWVQSGNSKHSSREAFNRAVVINGWEFYVAQYRDDTNEPEYVATVFREYLEREQNVYPPKPMERLIQYAERNWDKVRTGYERRRIQQEWRNFQNQIIEEQRTQAQERGEEFELDIDDDQGVSALTREWAQVMLTPDEEEAECLETNEEEAVADPEPESIEDDQND
jgi:hypothetical protein